MTDVVSRLADPDYVLFQYADDERLRVRIETHARHSENPIPFTTWVLERVDARPGQVLLDMGSGPGQYHDQLRGVRVVALDLSAGMLAKVTVPAVQGDAQALPFRDATFERVMANHVLYHVPDVGCALQELRRVARVGARVVMACNSRTSMRPLFKVMAEVAAELGVAASSSGGLRFALEDLPLVSEVFPDARVDVYEDALRFTSPEPLLAYVASLWVGTLPDSQRIAFLRRLEERVRAIIAQDGAFRVPKRAGCFVAEVQAASALRSSRPVSHDRSTIDSR